MSSCALRNTKGGGVRPSCNARHMGFVLANRGNWTTRYMKAAIVGTRSTTDTRFSPFLTFKSVRQLPAAT
jgi:hypothetical protein